MPIKNTRGGRTYPKPGRLGTGAYHRGGSPIAVNPFGPNVDQPVSVQPPAPAVFGQPSNAGNGTQFGQNRVTTGAGLPHPNTGFNKISQQASIPPVTASGADASSPQSPFISRAPRGTVQNTTVQPHERNFLTTRKILGNFRTVSGASRIMPADTAFKRVPPLTRPVHKAPIQQNVLRIPPKTRPSFVSRNHLWTDPNQSFLQGKTNINGEVGAGRWQTIKRGAAG
jgi:hypothetical protein